MIENTTTLQTAYTNSNKDLQKKEFSDEKNVRSMYEWAPYPDLSSGLKSMDVFLKPIEEYTKSKKNLNFLDVGCGTGHYAVGVAAKHPQWRVSGIDLSSASLEIADKLKKITAVIMLNLLEEVI